MWQQATTDRFLHTLQHLEYGSITVTTPDGNRYGFQGKYPGAHGNFHIADWRTIPALAAKGDIGLTEAYRDGWWDTDDLTLLMLVGLENEAALDKYIYGGVFARLASRVLYLFNRNTLGGSKRNIHAHYDLGNDFYKLWLDPSMSYSAALFHHEHESLEQAQYNKYGRIIDRLDSNSGSLLEIGCGWGGFAEQAAQRGDYGIKGITLSEQQHDYAHARLDGHAKIVLEDYRKQQGKYNHIVSIEMFEAVGEKFWATYFSKMKSLLDHKGTAVVQTITMGEPYFERYRKSGDMVRSFIFPGGMLPTHARFEEEAAKVELKVTDSFSFGSDYGATLKHWLRDFEAKLPEVRNLGFDEPFIRVWRFYLAACVASFQTQRTDVMQLELQHV